MDYFITSALTVVAILIQTSECCFPSRQPETFHTTTSVFYKPTQTTPQLIIVEEKNCTSIDDSRLFYGQCKNKGYCVLQRNLHDGSTASNCQCLTGWTGQYCERRMRSIQYVLHGSFGLSGYDSDRDFRTGLALVIFAGVVIVLAFVLVILKIAVHTAILKKICAYDRAVCQGQMFCGHPQPQYMGTLYCEDPECQCQHSHSKTITCERRRRNPHSTTQVEDDEGLANTLERYYKYKHGPGQRVQYLQRMSD